MYALIFFFRLCVFHKLLAFPVTGGGSNIGVIEGKLAPLRQAHIGVSWAETVASLATRLEANFTIGRSNLAFDCRVYCTYAGAG